MHLVPLATNLPSCRVRETSTCVQRKTTFPQGDAAQFTERFKLRMRPGQHYDKGTNFGPQDLIRFIAREK